MTPEELLEKIKKIESTLAPEERLKWLRDLNKKIKEKEEEVRSLIGALQANKDRTDVAELKSKMHKDITTNISEAM
jgi:hypothetical protein